MKNVELDRRQVATGIAAALTMPLAAGAIPGVALAQESNGTWRDLADLSQEAQRLGLSVPRMNLAPSAAGETYNETLPAVIDFMDSVQASAPDAPGVSSSQVDALLERASDILRAARNAEKSPRETGPAPGVPSVAAPTYDAIAEDYRKLFATCQVNEANRADAMWYASKIADPTRRKMYEQVYEETCVPWYVVGVIHGMEAGFDVKGHLHNGDPLKNKTVQVPKNRPDPWNPPSDWVSSAVDAMKYDKLSEKTDWDLASILFRWEAYNGWSSRVVHHINTPYLWSYSNHYTRGKYVADGVWDGNAVSKQCGAAVMLKLLIETGAVSPIA